MVDNTLTSPDEAAAREQLDGVSEEGKGARLRRSSSSQDLPVTHDEDDGNRFQKAISAWRSEYACQPSEVTTRIAGNLDFQQQISV